MFTTKYNKASRDAGFSYFKKVIKLKHLTYLVLSACLLASCSTNTTLKSENTEVPNSMDSELDLALSGNASSQEKIGELYHYGKEGIEKNYAKAIYWYNLAAQQDYASSQDYLGLFYAGGLGTKKDCGVAIKWFKSAYYNGFKQSKGNLVWMLSTCENDSMRDGKLALQLAVEDIKENGVGIARLDNFSAALAETGDFEKAIEIQGNLVAALQESNQKLRLIEFKKRLMSYKNKKAWRGASYVAPNDYSK